MRAVAVLPARRELTLLDLPTPELHGPHDVLVRTLLVGVCGTDREICSFAYGTPPSGEAHLVLGHEAIGRVVAVGAEVSTLKPGDRVVPSVRRPCPHPRCQPCREGRQDFCATGDFVERGIKERHGFMTELFVEEDEFLHRVPPELGELGVLAEPLTIAEKALAQVWAVQSRLPWGERSGEGRTAVVLGAGPVGLLGAMLLVARGFSTFVYSRSPAPNPKAAVAEAVGARYLSCLELPAASLRSVTGAIDVVYEAVGVAEISFAVMRHLAPNGVFVFTGIPPELPAIPVAADSLMRQLVLHNQAVVGTVNADVPAFEAALEDLLLFRRRWPAALQALVSGRFPPDAYRELLVGPQQGIKNLISFL
jgi:glucose 1-dehydrogenase